MTDDVTVSEDENTDEAADPVDPQRAKELAAIRVWCEGKIKQQFVASRPLEADNVRPRYHVTVQGSPPWYIVWLDPCYGSDTAKVVKSEEVHTEHPPTVEDVLKVPGGEIPVSQISVDDPEELSKIKRDLLTASGMGDRAQWEAERKMDARLNHLREVLAGRELPEHWRELAGIQKDPLTSARERLAGHAHGFVLAACDYIESLRREGHG